MRLFLNRQQPREATKRCGAFDQKIELNYLNQYFQKMNYSLNVLKEIEIKANSFEIWNTITSNKKLSDCLKMSVNCNLWEKGQTIYFNGFINDLKFSDKAKITEFQQNKLLTYNYFKSGSDNFTELSFSIKRNGKNSSKLILRGKGFLDADDKIHAEKTWAGMLQILKTEIEKTHHNNV